MKLMGFFSLAVHTKGACMTSIPTKCQRKKLGINNVRVFHGHLGPLNEKSL